MAVLGSDEVGVAAALGSLDSGDEGLGALPEPPGHIVSVKSD